MLKYNEIAQEQLERDLAWILSSSSMVKDEKMKVISFHELIAASELPVFIKKHSEALKKDFDLQEGMILGKYFERLCHFFFTHHPRFEVLHYAKQFFDGKDTLGELDFVLRDKENGLTLHLEVAIKYYLAYKNTAKHDLWIGPNGSDTLAKKMKKFKKQLLLSDALDENIDVKGCLICGYLFHHYQKYVAPYFLDPSMKLHRWAYLDEMDECLEKKKEYAVVPKKAWISFYREELNFLKGERLKKEIREQVNSIRKGIMLLGEDDSILMILPSHWPKL